MTSLLISNKLDIMQWEELHKRSESDEPDISKIRLFRIEWIYGIFQLDFVSSTIRCLQPLSNQSFKQPTSRQPKWNQFEMPIFVVFWSSRIVLAGKRWIIPRSETKRFCFDLRMDKRPFKRVRAFSQDWLFCSLRRMQRSLKFVRGSFIDEKVTSDIVLFEGTSSKIKRVVTFIRNVKESLSNDVFFPVLF